MKHLIVTLSLALLSVFGAADASAKKPVKNEPAVAVFTLTPKMTCQNCENKIKTNLRFEKGVKNIVTDLKAQTVTIKYDSLKTTPDNLVTAFKKIGYTAKIRPRSPIFVNAGAVKRRADVFAQ